MQKNRDYWRRKETYTSEDDFKKFKMIRIGQNSKNYNIENQIEQYGAVLKQYPMFRIYGFNKAIKWYCEERGLEYYKPTYYPDLYLVTSNFVVCIEIENTSRWSDLKQKRLINWYLEIDDQEVFDLYIYRFDRYGNYQNVIFPNAEKSLKTINDVPIEHREYFKNLWLQELHMEQEILLDVSK